MADEGQTSRIEIVIAVVLSVAGLVTSWASYQSSLWSGQQDAHYSRATALRVQASQAALDRSTLRAVEVGLFTSWLSAKSAGDDALAGFYEQRFPADLKPAFEAWMAQRPLQNPTAPPSPFAMSNYGQRGEATSKLLEAKADAEFEAGQQANDWSDGYTQSAVALAMAMFFGGIAQVFRARGVRLALTFVAIVACGVGLQRIARLPMIFSQSPAAAGQAR